MKPTEAPRRSQRIERTQRALLESLLDLIVEKGYERTTVEDVLRRADVGRTAFYAHFENKQDLLLHRFADIPWLRRGEGRCDEYAAGLFNVSFLFEHVAQQRELVVALRGTSAFEEAVVSLRDNLLESFTRLLQDRSTDGDVERNVQLTAQVLTGALMQLLMWWLDAEMPETPATMASWFAQLGERMVDV
jgi:AcrR family transcriptional regulator